MQAYGIYQDIRNSSWQCLIDCGIDNLPIDILKITRHHGIHVIKNSCVNVLNKNEKGRSYFSGTDWHVVYDDSCPTQISRFTVAHELGHIFLKHELKLLEYGHMRSINPKPLSEEQADKFAVRLLCPACVLWGLDLHTAEEIARHCRVDMSIAEKRARRMKTLYGRGKFLTSPLEHELYQQFLPYIKRSIYTQNSACTEKQLQP